MNKLLTKIVGVALGGAMAIGVGLAVASNAKEAMPVHAATGTVTFNVTGWNGNTTGTSYISSETSGKDTSSTYSATMKNYIPKSGQVKGNQTSVGSNWYMFNTTAIPAPITKVEFSNGGGTLQNHLFAVFGTSSQGSVTDLTNAISASVSNSKFTFEPSASNNYTFFKLLSNEKFGSGNVTGCSVVVTYGTSTTALTSIGLSGTGVSSNAISIGSSDSTAHTINVSLTPSTATDQKVNIAHQSGTSGLFTKSASQITCSSGSGSFTITGTNATSGSETFRISGNTETSVYVDLVVTALDDSVTFYTVTFNSNGGSSSPAAQQVEEDDTFEFPSPGTKTHYSFDGWSSDGGTTKYAAGATSPAVGDDITYTAYWTEDAKYTVTYSAGTHGTGSYAHTNQYGGTYTLLAIANVSGVSADSGYRFKNYTVGGVNKNPGDTFTLSAATTVTVNFEEQPPEDVLTSSVIPAAAVGSSTSSWGTASTFSDSTGAVYTGRFMGVSSSSFIGRLNDSANGYIYTSTVPSNMKLKSVSISSMTASKTVGVYAQSGAYTACVTDKSTALGTITPDSLTYTFDSNTSYNAICLRGHTSSTEIGTVTITYEALAVLDSVTTSGQTASFTAGNKWSYGGTLTAHYTAGKADATVTPTSFKYGASGINPTTAGTTITTDTYLNHDTHNGKYIYVVYTEDDITKWASYQITVNYAAVTSVVIDTHTAEIGLNETYNYNLVGVTVNTEYAQQGYEWLVSDNTVDDDYYFDGTGLLSGDKDGTITLRCRSTADNSKYDELVVTVTGDPTADFTPASVSGYAGKSTDVAFTYSNMGDENLIAVTSGNTSYATIGGIAADEGEGLVTVNFVAVGSTTISISYDGGETLASITVTVSADSVTAVNWSASNIKVYSGTVITADIDNTWEVNYEMASGDADYITYGDYTVKLGGSTITLPHTWDASDDGKTLCVEYGGVQSSTVSVDVTQTLRPVMADITSESTYTFSANTWTYSEGSGEWSGSANGNGYTSGQGVQMTTSQDGATVTSASSYSNISQIVITYNTNKSSGAGSFDVKVGTNASQNVSAAWQSGDDGRSMNYTATFDYATKQSGVVAFTVNVGTNSLWVKSIKIVTSTGSTDIANKAGHEAAQKAVVKFAKAFNTAMDTTNGCTTNMSSAWSTATAAWATFNNDISSLSAAEQTYAKNLIKYASAQWTENTDDDFSYCLERAMATYEKCVKDHGQTAFMSSVRTVQSSNNVGNNLFTVDSSKVGAASIIIIMISATVVGGYFFLRKKKKEN